MILTIPGSGTMGTGMGTMPWYESSMSESHEYGSETMSMCTGTNFRISTGIWVRVLEAYKSTKLSPLFTAVIEKPGYRFVHEVCRIFSF